MYQIRTQTSFPDIVDASLRMTDMPGGTQAVLISTYAADSAVTTAFLGVFRWDHLLPYLTVNSLTVDQVTPKFFQSLPVDKDYAFFVEPGHPEVVAALKDAFMLNDVQYSPQADMPPEKGFLLYYAPLDKQPHPLRPEGEG